MPLGVYISVPFCRTKCTFCNFASGVSSKRVFDRYVARVSADIASAEHLAVNIGGKFDPRVDTIYLGGGTPSVFSPDQLGAIFVAIRTSFDVSSESEITVECAPGTLSAAIIQALVNFGVNRVSLGVQSFVDRECASIGRLHTRETVLNDISHLRSAGITNINIDLIAGLPYQTGESWRYSVDETIATEVPHVSVYMLEVDEDSRLGRELIAGGTRYHAHHVPDDDHTADFYVAACEILDFSGVTQYEISNFARGELTNGIPEFHSRHNLKYWCRDPYLGFGVDAHSMLPALAHAAYEAVRFSTSESLDAYLAKSPGSRSVIDQRDGDEECFFLGLRLNRGVDLLGLKQSRGVESVERHRQEVTDLCRDGLVELDGEFLRLTSRGRLLSNDVFERFIREPEPSKTEPVKLRKQDLIILQ